AGRTGRDPLRRTAPDVRGRRADGRSDRQCAARAGHRARAAGRTGASGFARVRRGVPRSDQDRRHSGHALDAAHRGRLRVSACRLPRSCGRRRGRASVSHRTRSRGAARPAARDRGRADLAAVFATIAQERPTVFYGVPSAYAAMLATDGEHDVSSVRLFVSAGEALPRPIFERWKARFGAEILDGIGSTEIGYIAISNFTGRARAGTSGEVIPGYEAKVAGADGAPVESGEVGDLMVRG